MLRILLIALFLASPAFAHDHSRPDLKDWFPTLQSKKKDPCCDGTDAKHLTDVEWSTKDGHYTVKLNGRWVDVPDSAVVEGPNREGSALVWPYFLDGEPIGIRCFMPATMT